MKKLLAARKNKIIIGGRQASTSGWKNKIIAGGRHAAARGSNKINSEKRPAARGSSAIRLVLESKFFGKFDHAVWKWNFVSSSSCGDRISWKVTVWLWPVLPWTGESLFYGEILSPSVNIKYRFFKLQWSNFPKS